jgi:serine/threonine-protein kinase
MQAQARLGRYELLARLATGGMGEIFLARLEGAAGFEKLYVVKRILPHLADDARFRQMLIAEARIASKMSHANICQVYELGETDGQLYIVMEYLEGITMLPLLRRASKETQPLELGFVGGIIQQTCDALHYAHELKERGEYLGIVHRDVTPSNVFLTESGIAKVLDFGIAKAKGASTNTQEGTVKGKYAYMAPEQLRGAAIDRRVDVFALGIVIYEMLALRRLFQRKTDYLTFRAVMEQPIPDLRRYRPDLPDAMAATIAKALDRDPANRFETARQFGSAMLDALSPMRPWSQGELGDFVHANFADEIGKRSQQVQSAVHRTASGVHGVNTRSTMPLIAQTDTPNEGELDEDDGFPSVETVDSKPGFPVPMMSSGSAPVRAASGDFVGSTPPPFGSESTGSAPSLQPLRGGAAVIPPGPQSAPMTAVPQRNLVWPLLAAAMVLVAGGALFLVWKQMQQQAQTTSVVIQQSSDDRHPNEADKPDKPDRPVGPDKVEAPDKGGSDATVATPKERDPKRRTPPPPTLSYNGAIDAKKPAMVRCLNDHRDDGLPNEAITVSIKISTSGKAKTVSLSPGTLNSTPVGACLRDVLMSAAFPAATTDVDITVPLKPKTT